MAIDLLFPPDAVAVLRQQSESNFPATAYIFSEVQTRTPGGVTGSTWVQTAVVACRLRSGGQSRREIAGEIQGAEDYIFVVPAGTDLQTGMQAIITGVQYGVPWRVVVVVIGSTAPRTHEAIRKVRATTLGIAQTPAAVGLSAWPVIFPLTFDGSWIFDGSKKFSGTGQ